MIKWIGGEVKTELYRQTLLRVLFNLFVVETRDDFGS